MSLTGCVTAYAAAADRGSLHKSAEMLRTSHCSYLRFELSPTLAGGLVSKKKDQISFHFQVALC